jgi:hypothetical protein
MNKYPDVKCRNCGKLFETQIKIDPAIYKFAPGIRVGVNTFTCPHCNTQDQYSEEDFLYTPQQVLELASFGKTVRAFVEHIRLSETPLQAASELLSGLEQASTTGDVNKLRNTPRLLKLRKWLPNSPEKVAAYVAVAHVIFQILTREPSLKIEYQTVVNEIHQTYIVQEPHNATPARSTKLTPKKPGRNDPCHCGSGRKFKHCHGS